MTYFGDADLDGQFNSSDLVLVLAAGEYEDDLAMNSGWASGDWDGDGDFTTGDLIEALAHGGYERAAAAAGAAVPEPTWTLVAWGLVGFMYRLPISLSGRSSRGK
jgi:hypothetical protein